MRSLPEREGGKSSAVVFAEQAGPLGGAFYDWRMIDDASLLLMVGDACDDGIEAALASSALRAALRMDDDQLPDDKRFRASDKQGKSFSGPLFYEWRLDK